MTLADDTTPRTRRSILAAAAAGAAAAAAAAIAPAKVDAVSTSVMTEVDNPTTEGTSISNSDTDSTDFAFAAIKAGGGSGLRGESDTGPGTFGLSADTSDPATNVAAAGVVGIAGGTDVADNFGLTGVYGYSDASPADGFVGVGVWGDSPDIGVVGTGATGVQGIGIWGVQGYTEVPGGVAVYAQSADAGARALRVQGRAEFTRSGRTTISAGSSSKQVSLAGCTTSTLVFAVLGSNRSGRWVRAVVPAAGSFTVYLNTSVTSATYITWIAFTNPSNHGG
jgi:hypothetical protein